jgi:hypothetical protein
VADGYPFWVDAKTPPKREGDQEGHPDWFTRPRDFYWTLDQATLALVKDKEGTLLVEFGNSMPFFKQYRVTIDGVEVKAVAQPFPWRLREGANRLEVAPVGAYGKTGLKSTLEVHYTAPH